MNSKLKLLVNLPEILEWILLHVDLMALQFVVHWWRHFILYTKISIKMLMWTSSFFRKEFFTAYSPCGKKRLNEEPGVHPVIGGLYVWTTAPSQSLSPWARHFSHPTGWWCSEGLMAPIAWQSSSLPQGSCDYNVAHHYQCVNVWLNGWMTELSVE